MSQLKWRDTKFDASATARGSDGTAIVSGEQFALTGIERHGAELSYIFNGRRYRYLVSAAKGEAWVSSANGTFQLIRSGARGSGQDFDAPAQSLTSRMPGRVLRLTVEPGTLVEKGQLLLVLEAMKMELEIAAPTAGTVTGFPKSAGEPVMPGDLLVNFEPAAAQ
jgi:biotin carboxyl carrier protein